MLWRGRRKSKPSQPVQKRAFRLERLETRDMLAGVVNVLIAPMVAAGDMVLEGDVSNNEVEVRSGANFGEFVVKGLNGTLLQINGAGVTMAQTPPLNGINGSIRVELAGGADKFFFEGPDANSMSRVGDDLLITNDVGDQNVIRDVLINGDLLIDRVGGSAGYTELQVIDTTVIGDTIVDNATGGSNGDSKTLISNSKLQAGGAGSWGLWLRNADGADLLQVEGMSDFGTGIFPPASPVIHVENGDGGSRSTFTGQSTVYGAVEIYNGANIVGTLDIVTFNQAEVVGAVEIYDTDGDTETSVQSSSLGTWMTTGSPLVVRNNVGADHFIMQDSDVQWGVLLNNDTGAGGASMWGSSTDIRDSEIGTHPNGPALPAPAGAGDALMILGDQWADTVSISGTELGGDINLEYLYDGNNSVELTDSQAAALRVETGDGNDTVLINDSELAVQLYIYLYGGVDTLEIRGTNTLPSPLLGMIVLDGGVGVDTYKSNTILPLVNFEVFVPV